MFLLVGSGYTQQTPGSSQDKPSVYMELVAKIREGDDSVNFGEVRRAYVAWINSGAKKESPNRDEMVKAFEAKNFAKGVQLGEKVVDLEMINAGLLGAMADAYRSLGDGKKAEFFERLMHKARHGLFLSGDGKTAKTAYFVMSIPEEYRVMRELGYTVSMQSLMHIDGQAYDVLSGMDDKGKAVEVYFNICSFFGCGQVKR